MGRFTSGITTIQRINKLFGMSALNSIECLRPNHLPYKYRRIVEEILKDHRTVYVYQGLHSLHLDLFEDYRFYRRPESFLNIAFIIKPKKLKK